MENIFVEFLPPWVLTGRQPAFYDKESGTVLQQTARMYDRVNMLVRMFNKLSKETKTIVEDYINQFNELHDYVQDYFDNLDVQEEINNKLDDMVEAGTLQEIITEYIQANVAWCFNTVADMKLAENLVAGSYARTLGFYYLNDGGGALYYITNTGTANEIDTIAVGDGLYAKIVIENEMSVAQFGARGDDLQDDADNLIACFNKCSNIRFAKNGTYLSSKDITVANGGVVNLNGSTVKMYNRLEEGDSNICIFKIDTAVGVEFMNGELFGDIDDRETYPDKIFGLIIRESSNINVHNLKISKCTADGIICSKSNFVDIHDCEVSTSGRNNISLLYGDNITMHDLNVHDCIGKNLPGHGIDIEPYASDQPVKNLEIYNIYTKGNSGSGVNLSFYEDGEVSAFVHNIYSLDMFSIKTGDNSDGVVVVKDIYIENELFIQDPVSSDMFIDIDNVNIKNYIPTTTTSFWGSAIKIRAGIASTSTNIYNVKIKNVNIDGGTPTRGVYIAGGDSGSGNVIDGFTCNINTIPLFTASTNTAYKGWDIYNVKSDYVASTTSKLMPAIINSLSTSGITIDEGFPIRDKIKIVNTVGNRRSVTSQGNNNYGVTTFLIPPKCECYITVKADGTISIDSDKVVFEIAANTSYTFNVQDINLVSSTRSTHYNIYYVDYSNLLELKSDGGGSGATLSLTDGVLSVTGHTSSTTLLYLMK